MTTAALLWRRYRLGMLDQIPGRQIDSRRDRRISGFPLADRPLGHAQQGCNCILGQPEPVAPVAKFLRVHVMPPIFQGQPGKLVTSPAPCPYRRMRSLKRHRLHPLRDKRIRIFIRSSLGNHGGLFPRGTKKDSGTEFHIQAETRNSVPFLGLGFDPVIVEAWL